MPDNPVPVRLQRFRVRGFNLQSNSRAINGLPAKCCTRPGKWSNPFKLCRIDRDTWGICDYKTHIVIFTANTNRRAMASMAIQKFLVETSGRQQEIRTELRGYNLACFCRLCEKHKETGLPMGTHCPDCAPCHCDPLLEIANSDD